MSQRRRYESLNSLCRYLIMVDHVKTENGHLEIEHGSINVPSILEFWVWILNPRI